jgi:tetratricopeptide (TPR) repeat protein
MIQHGLMARAKPIPVLAAFVVLCVSNPQMFSEIHTRNVSDSTPQQSPGTSVTPEEANGDILMAQKKYQAAIREFAKAPQNSAVVCNKTGMAYHYMFNMAAAKSYYERALKLDPKYPQAMNNLAAVLYGEKKYGQAEKLYKKALKLSPRDASIYSNLGTLYFVRGDTTKGSEAYRKAFSIDPRIFERSASSGLGEGISTQQRALMNYSLAKTYANVGMNERALQYLRMALDEGFKDRKKLMEDKEFADLRATPEFQQLVAERR